MKKRWISQRKGLTGKKYKHAKQIVKAGKESY